jgi:hypothetical protein
MSFRRVLLAAVTVSVGAALGALSVIEDRLTPPGADRERYPRVMVQWGIGESNLPWERENLYDGFQQFARIGDGLTVGTSSQIAPVTRTSPEPIRVVVIGDSFVWGHGYDDPDALWWRHLERELNARTAPGSFTVVGHGYNGMSTMSQNEWLTPARVAELDADLVILAVANNDTVADGLEQTLCPLTVERCDGLSVFITPQYRECVDGQRGLAGNAVRLLVRPWFPNTALRLLGRFCDPERIASELDLAKEFDRGSDPTSSIFMSDWLRAVAEMKAKLGETPVYSFPIGWHKNIREQRDELAGLLAERGYRTLDTAEADRFALDSTAVELYINPVDSHISQAWGVLYAREIAQRLLADLDPARINAARGAHPAQPLISYTTPADMSVVARPEYATVSYDPAADKHPFSLNTSGKELPPQQAGCIRLGEPYARIAFDREIATGERVTLRSTGDTALRVRSYGYDENYLLVYSDPVVLRPGGTLVIAASPRGRGVLISDLDRRGCELNRPIGIPGFELSLTRG